MENSSTNKILELDKTNWIIIGVVATLLVLFLGFVFLKPAKYTFKTPLDKELSDIKRTDYQVSPQTLAKAIIAKDKNIVLVDVRSQFDFAKGHLPDAINIYKVNLMDDANMEFFENLKEGHKKAILYGNSASDANVPFMILKQMDVENIQFLSVGYDDVKAVDWVEMASNTDKFNDENAVVDFAQFISDANKSRGIEKTIETTAAQAKPSVIIRPKKSASKDEGC
jgi:rhodanese-related sulfurtransferase